MRDQVGCMAVLAKHAVVMIVINNFIRNPESCSRCYMVRMKCMAAVCCY